MKKKKEKPNSLKLIVELVFELIELFAMAVVDFLMSINDKTDEALNKVETKIKRGVKHGSSK